MFASLSLIVIGISPLLATSTDTSMQNYRFVQKPEIKVIGIACRAANFTEEGPKEIVNLWEKFYNEDILNKIPNRISDDVIGLYCDYDGDYTQPYSLVIGCQVNSDIDIPEGMVSKVVPGGSYAVFKAVGEHPIALIETWQNIWQTDLKRTYTGDYELYGDNFFKKSPQEVDIFIAIEKM